ncbi:MAG TPA: Mur ligase family protein [bacterium]|nr:Mur ligase family protein [bacterium]
MIDIEQVLNKIYSLNEFSIKLGLENIKKALELTGLDLSGIHMVHVAGTNGKGSTSSVLYSILRTKFPKEKIGLYTSPHLIKYNERIIINDQLISDDEIEELSATIFNKTKEINLTFFEFTTLLALLHFKSNNVSYAVIETGLGGRLDATNIISPEVCIITSIGLDHQQYLGNSLEKIALEKAGIFKKGVKVIISKTNCMDILKKEAEKIKTSKILSMGEDFDIQINEKGTFDIFENKNIVLKGLVNKLEGEHQIINTACAIMASRSLGVITDKDETQRAIDSTQWKGRLEKRVFKGKTIILDVSHNVEGMLATAKFMKDNYKDKSIYTGCGFMKDKDYNSMIDIISSFSDKVYLIPTKIKDRELKKTDYLTSLTRHPDKLVICKDHMDCFNKIIDSNGIILLTGSIYNYQYFNRLLGA